MNQKNKLIMKNTALLYMRMLLIMAVSLYTTRVVLNALGVQDYGIYNVVGGFVTMFGFLNSSMTSATQRFLSFELGRKDFNQLAKVFSMSLNIHFIIALAILVFAETIGLWFVNTQLTIPAERMVAANWVYQFSILAFMVTVISVPYNAIIIAHEKMSAFALIGVVEAGSKLLIAFMVLWCGFDKLKLYAILVFAVALIIRVIYGIYCSRNFRESRFRFYWDKSLFKTLMDYAGWNLWGNVASVLYGQGVNVLLNIFFGPAVNAARGIAYQAKGAIYRFVENFQMAINPQIVKSFASDDSKYMHQLIFKGAKYSFFLLFALSLPVLLETEIILNLWLKTVPGYTVIFTQLVIINILIDSISGPLRTAAQASGKIKLYQAVVGGLLIFILPISYLFLKLGFPPQVTLYVSITVSVIALLARLIIISPLVKLSITRYFMEVILRIMLVAIISAVFPLTIKQFLSEGIQQLIIICFVSLISVALVTYLIGLSRPEKIFVQVKTEQIIGKIKNRNV
jgi:O-antigen/teichoic acid export membrane protein